MEYNSYGGMFIAVDGPNGVGKSTIIKSLAKELANRKVEVYTTKEPSNTELGEFVRRSSESTNGYTLACLVAADRYQHLENEIIPQLKYGKVVITDRYVLSSLILQKMDNVSENFILAINENIIVPDLQIALFADQETIRSRLAQRDYLTRFENNSQKELDYLQKGIFCLKEQKFNIMELNNNNDLTKNTKIILDKIIEGIK